jgi:hypothetical protein
LPGAAAAGAARGGFLMPCTPRSTRETLPARHAGRGSRTGRAARRQCNAARGGCGGGWRGAPWHAVRLQFSHPPAWCASLGAPAALPRRHLRRGGGRSNATRRRVRALAAAARVEQQRGGVAQRAARRTLEVPRRLHGGHRRVCAAFPHEGRVERGTRLGRFACAALRRSRGRHAGSVTRRVQQQQRGRATAVAARLS